MAPNEELKQLNLATAIGEVLNENDPYQFACDLLIPPIALKAIVEVRKIKDPKIMREQIFLVPGKVLWHQLKQYGYLL